MTCSKQGSGEGYSTFPLSPFSSLFYADRDDNRKGGAVQEPNGRAHQVSEKAGDCQPGVRFCWISIEVYVILYEMGHFVGQSHVLCHLISDLGIMSNRP